MSDENYFFTLETSDPAFERDQVRHLTVKSPALGHRADISLFVPEGSENASQPLPLVLLLHGVYGSHWAWLYKGGVHRTADKLIAEGRISPMILAMPSDGLWQDGSGYLPHQHRDYERWILEDVPRAVYETIAQTNPDAPLFIAGLSMGGYGALRLAAKYPHRFQACAGLSSVIYFEQLNQFVEGPRLDIPIPATEKSLLDLMLKNKDALPPIRFDCGRDDFLLPANREFHQALQQHNIAHIYEEFDGDHNWDYWQKHIVDALLFFNE